MSFGAILCIALSAVYLAESQPTIKIDVPGDRKYLVIGESVRKFLYCIALNIPQSLVTLCRLSDRGLNEIDDIIDPRYSFDCTETTENVTCEFGVSKVEDGDAGIYICTAQNCNNILRSEIPVSVYNKPLIDHIAESTINGAVPEGQLFFLNCYVEVPIEGTAGFSMEWRHNAKTVKSQDKYSNFIYSVQSASRSDAGYYSCTVLLNGTDLDTSTVAIDVTYAAQITSFFARTSDGRLDPGEDGVVYANAGENVIIECTAEGNPVPVVEIRHRKEVPVIESSAGGTTTFFRNITRADGAEDNGIYICQANNSLNPVAAEKSMEFFVYKTPAITFFGLADENDAMNSTGCRKVTVGKQQSLGCRADGEPPPFVVIINDEGQNVANSSGIAIYVFTAEKNETYECWAKTAATNSATNASFSLCSSPSKSFIALTVTLSAFGVAVVLVFTAAIIYRNRRRCRSRELDSVEPKKKKRKSRWWERKRAEHESLVK